LLKWIKENLLQYNRPLVFISSDDFLNFFSKHRSFLEQYFTLEIPSSQLIDSLQNKYFQYTICIDNNINAPETFIVNESLDSSKLKYPAFLKGLDVNIWRSHFGGSFKGFVIKDEDEYKRITNSYNIQEVPSIIQELIEGPDENHFKYCAYRNAKGDILAEFMLQKLVQFPKGYGIGASVKSIYDSELLEQGRKLFHGINYVGVGSAEFKRDQKDKVLKLIELNPRYWQQNFLATQCGVNFPEIQIQNHQNKEIISKGKYDLGVVWMNRLLTARALAVYLKAGFSSFQKRLRMLKGKKVYSHQFSADQGPFYKEAQYGLVFLKLPFVLLKQIINNRKY
jgi:predicted ATP-grasp superfamily ATP-dependent carboligase